jgi:hypothetical protein
MAGVVVEAGRELAVVAAGFGCEVRQHRSTYCKAVTASGRRQMGTGDPAADAAKQHLPHLRLALLLGRRRAMVEVDVPDWVRMTLTGFAFLDGGPTP